MFLFNAVVLSVLLMSCGVPEDGLTPPAHIPIDANWKRYQDPERLRIWNDEGYALTSEVFEKHTDILRSQKNKKLPAVFQRIIDSGMLTKVTDKYGPTRINIKEIQDKFPKALVKVFRSKFRAWSGWWLPYSDLALFQTLYGFVSPLEKYDLVSNPQALSAVAEEKANARHTNAHSSEGLCDAWSRAALLHPEPIQETLIRTEFGPVPFNVGDLKALVVMSYSDMQGGDVEQFGEYFKGTAEGWISPDPLPDQVHRLLEVTMVENQLPIIMDHDPEVEVWNIPVSGGYYAMLLDPNDKNKIVVRLTLETIEPTTRAEDKADRSHLDFVGAKKVIRSYNYTLTGERDPQDENFLNIEAGDWIRGVDGQDSANNHPDAFTVIQKPETAIRKSRNKALSTKVIDEITSQSFGIKERGP